MDVSKFLQQLDLSEENNTVFLMNVETVINNYDTDIRDAHESLRINLMNLKYIFYKMMKEQGYTTPITDEAWDVFLDCFCEDVMEDCESIGEECACGECCGI